jgi:nucleoside-diphosphate-sugar epimerase
VRRFVFASSVSVYGSISRAGVPFLENSPASPHPSDIYAQSKLAAESFLLSGDTGAALESIVIRFPLIYGPKVKGNMAMLMKLAHSGLPLPLANIGNRRSFINITNAMDFLLTAAKHPDSAGKVLLASDQEDASTSDLLRAIAHASGKPSRLFPMPPGFLKLACSLIGKTEYFEKLTGNFQIDPAASCALLGWAPKMNFADGIAQMVTAR